jgi:UDP-N-acetylglucosamine--N-acetylmuramyl-(pentapeptide) pyrophosphoryl-undecaprenol N-acetylglucosamine transferase
MKIILTGGGTGGHFYPLIAVAEELNKIADKEHILDSQLFYLSDDPYDKEALRQNGITFEKISAGKLRKYFSVRNFLDIFKTFFGFFGALWTVYKIYPDVVFSKGGYISFPVLLAARILRVPIFIHESDSAPGRVNLWASKFAARIAVSFEEAGKSFPEQKTAWIGQPVRQDLQKTVKEGAFEYLKLDPSVPVIFVTGGSLGAELINSVLIESLPQLVSKYQIIHQTGKKNIEEVNIRAGVILRGNPDKERYHTFPFLNVLAMKMSAGASSLIISRAGSVIFEIASWGVPSIIIPITNSQGDHQRKNAFNYARAGAAKVIEENNLTSHVLVAEIDKLMNDKAKREEMSNNAIKFSKPDASAKIARELVDIALSHEK